MNFRLLRYAAQISTPIILKRNLQLAHVCDIRSLCSQLIKKCHTLKES